MDEWDPLGRCKVKNMRTPLEYLEKTPAKEEIWNAIGMIYRLLATEEARAILKVLLKQQEIRTTDLLEQTGLTESKFHPVLRQLVKYAIVDRAVNQDRSVSYKISPLGTNVLQLSNPVLNAIKRSIEQEQIITH